MTITPNDLDGLPSSINYRKLDNAQVYEYYYDYCDEKLPAELKGYEGFDKFCKKLGYNLDQLYKMQTYSELDGERCDALNIWIYDRLFSEIKRDEPYEISTFPFERFHYVWNKFPGNREKCKFLLESCSEENFKKMKEMFHLTINYNSIKHYVHSSGGTCSSDYNSYINKIVSTYKIVKDECPNNKPYCKFVEYIKGNYDQFHLLNLQCTSTSVHSAFSARGQALDISEDSTADAAGNSSSRVAMGVLFPLLCILFIFFALYTLTPFGSWFKVFLVKNKIIRHNINGEETIQSFEHTYVPEDIDNKCSSSYISYHAT
ncbi:PIR protein [Plasmodium ovale]|uniref:PIR protein n=1 Tax=Plasmodium ovale TaxID=36330 RepID=A0A1C3KEB0_PLAOA|nr:PIR protein [Plasmodium ovale]